MEAKLLASAAVCQSTLHCFVDWKRKRRRENIKKKVYVDTDAKEKKLSFCMERFHSTPKDITDKEQGGHVGVPNKRRLLVFHC